MRINNIYLLLILLINTIVFTTFIFFVPGFIADDFYIFTVIKENINNPISININNSFFLFLRPVTYFSFWLNIVAGFSPFFMKFFSLIIHLLLITSLFSFLRELSSCLEKKINNFWLALFVLFFSLSEVSTDWIVWLSQRNELLMTFFLILALKYYLRFISNYNISDYLLFVAFYILSILSKQSSVNLPFVLLFLHFWGYGKFKLKSIKYFIIPFVVLILFVIVNMMLIDNESKFLFYANLWKKPFSIVGTLVVTVIPYMGKYIYFYFMDNSSLALILLVIGSVTALVVIYKNLNKFRGWIYFCLIVMITFFPLIGHAVDGRNHSIQILLFTVFLFVVFMKSNFPKLSLGLILIFYVLLNFLNAFSKLDNYSNTIKSDFKVVEDYDLFIKTENKENSIIAANPLSEMIDYIYYYYKNNELGRYYLNATPIIAIGDYEMNIYENRISVLTINTSYLSYNDLDNNSNFKIICREHGEKRSLKLLTIIDLKENSLKNKKILYYKNGKWTLFKE